MEVSLFICRPSSAMHLLFENIWSLFIFFYQGDTKGSAKGTDGSAKKDGLQQQIPSSQVCFCIMIWSNYSLWDCLFIMEIDFNMLIISQLFLQHPKLLHQGSFPQGMNYGSAQVSRSLCIWLSLNGPVTLHVYNFIYTYKLIVSPAIPDSRLPV